MRGLRIAGLLSAVAAVAAGGALAMASPAAAAIPGDPITSNLNRNLCLEPQGKSAAQGTPIVQNVCDGSSTQNWRLDNSVSSSKGHVTNGNGMCMDARGGAVNGTPVVLWTCNSISNENWQSPPFTGKFISRVSDTSSHCLDVPFSSGQVGLQVWIWGCNGTLAQSWDAHDVVIVED
ncbi:RICIN domain-containing protein [Dactylosporangium sp. NPDC049525]|uniref:RICIN domain-containing protein n=1 Tax=Dactylosporangium sp. NPDC049525 TaxID=3154730 RepID=UPI00343E0835